MAPEPHRELRPQVLPRFDVPVNDVEGLVAALRLQGRPEGEAGVEAGGGEGVEDGVEGFAAGEDEVAVDPLRYSHVEAQGCGQVHEVAPCDADDGAGVGDDPVPVVDVRILGPVGEDALSVAVEVWGSTGPSIQGSGSSMGCFAEPRWTPYCFEPVLRMTRLRLLDAPVMARASRKLASIAPLTSQSS